MHIHHHCLRLPSVPVRANRAILFSLTSSSIAGQGLLLTLQLHLEAKYLTLSEMQSIIRALKRIRFLRAKPHQLSRSLSTTTSIPQYEPVDEEFSPGYDPKHYYPAKPGEVLADHYRLLVKIGWGSGSTVWLARDVARHVLTFIRNCGHGSHF